MRNVLTIAGREIKSYFVSPIAYVVLTGFLLLGGWFFFNLLSHFNFLLSIYSAMRNPEAQTRLNLNEFVMAPLLHNLSVVLVILVPVITMRSFAEEKRSGTYELLMTSPLFFAAGNLLLRRAPGVPMFDLSAWLCLVAALPLWHFALNR